MWDPIFACLQENGKFKIRSNLFGLVQDNHTGKTVLLKNVESNTLFVCETSDGPI